MAAPNVWTQMNYTPPRGPCNHKQSIMSGKCPCLRFMLHPLKSSSSYECDGCGHHASFHSMENKTEDEIRKRWEQEAKEKAEQAQEAQQRSKKRVRAIEYVATIGAPDGASTASLETSSSSGTRRTTKTRGTTSRRGQTSRARNREAVQDDDMMVVELD